MPAAKVFATGATRRHVLVLEPDPRGHAEEWLLHIARFVRDERPDVKVTLAIPEALAPRIAAEVRGDERLAIQPLAASEVASCLSANLAVGAFARWRAMRRHLRKCNADEGLFLCIDSLSLPFALGLGLGGRRASGILFRPSVHYASLEATPPSRRERIRDWRKGILYPLMLKNRALETVYSLDPYFPPHARTRYGDGGKVEELPDPIAEAAERITTAPRTERFPDGRAAFLLFGELTARKGVIQLLEACARVDPAASRRMAVLLAGRVDPSLESQVRDLLGRVRAARPELWIELDDRRLSSIELARAVDACDVVLAPYQRFVGSSGVLIWAARAQRPVITQRYGLLWRLVRDYGLGLAVDTTSPDALAAAMAQATDANGQRLLDAEGARKFLAHRDAPAFAARLLRVPMEAQHSFTESRARRVAAR